MLLATVTSHNHEALHDIDSLDFKQIAHKAFLAGKKNAGATTADAIAVDISSYRNFLKLILLNPGKEIVPTEEVDEIWHLHILDTQRYRRDCERIFGQMLEHYPYFGINDSLDQKMLQRAFMETRDLYRSTFTDGAYDKSDASRCKGHACHSPSPCRCRSPGACK